MAAAYKYLRESIRRSKSPTENEGVWWHNEKYV